MQTYVVGAVEANGHRYIDLSYGTTADQWTCSAEFHLDSAMYIVRSGGDRKLALGQLDCVREHIGLED